MVPQDSELIFLMGGTNDLGQVMGDLAWVAVSVVDTAWAADATYYNGGDFNISSFKGAVASTILKLQIWCPNARLVFASPLSGRGTTSGVNMTEPVYTNGFTTKDYRDAIEEVCIYMSTEFTDVFAKTGFNQFNRIQYITDSVHPYSVAGKKALAAAVVGSLKNIFLASDLIY